MEKKELKAKIYSKIDELPTLPTVVTKLLSLLEDEKTSASDITQTISRDPALTSKILKVANSAYYGFPQGIADMDRAVALLGFNMVKSLALSMGVMRSLPSGKGTDHFSQNALWLHSVNVATAIREMGNRYFRGNDIEHLFIVGLLHDIGMVVFNQFFFDLFEQVLEEVLNQETGELYIAEHKVIGLEHGETGAMLLKRWKFPSKIYEPIALHNTKDLPDIEYVKDVAMLRVAESIAHEVETKNGTQKIIHEINEADLSLLGMKEADLEDMKSYLKCEEEGIEAFFKAMI